MAKASNFNLSVLITANIADFSRKMNEVVAKTEKAGNQLKSIGTSLSVGVTAPIVGIGVAAVSSAVKFEKLAVSLNVLTGSAEKGAEMMQRLTEYSARTPFQLEDLARTNNMLLGFGLSAEDAFTALQQLGDVSALTGANINNIAVAYGQAAGEGRVMTRDLLQFVNNGVPIYKLLEEVTGQNAAALRQMASEGKISFDILKQAMSQATEQGGLFFQGTEKLSKTLGGQLSTLRDNFQLLLADFGDSIGTYLKPLTDQVTKLLQGFRGLSDETKATILQVAALAAAIGPLLATMGFLATNVLPGLLNAFTALTGPLGILTIAIGALGAAFVSSKLKALEMQGAFSLAAQNTQSLSSATDNLKSALNELDQARENGSDAETIRNLAATTMLRLQEARAVYDQIQAGRDLAIQRRRERIAQLEAMGASSEAIEVTKNLKGEIAIFEQASREAAEQISALEKRMDMVGKTIDETTAKTSAGTAANKAYRASWDQVKYALSRENFSTTIVEQSEEATNAVDDFFAGIDAKINRPLVTPNSIRATTQAIGTLTKNVDRDLTELGQSVNSIAQTIGQQLTNSFIALADGSENALESIVNMFKGLITQIIAAAAAAAILSAILSAIFPQLGAQVSFSAIFGEISGFGSFAEGGIVSGPTLGLVGEYSGARTNPEVIAPLDKLKSMLGNGMGGNVTLQGEIRGDNWYQMGQVSTERNNRWRDGRG